MVIDQRTRDRIARMVYDFEAIQWRLDHFTISETGFIDKEGQTAEADRDLLIWRAYTIAEDAVHLPESVRKALPGVPWRDIVGFRNIVAHGYHDVNRYIAWEVITRDLPDLVRQLQYLVNE